MNKGRWQYKNRSGINQYLLKGNTNFSIDVETLEDFEKERWGRKLEDVR